MERQLDLRRDSIPYLFKSFFFPTVIGMLVMALHIVIDGIFVGRGVGSNGLAAVNIFLPIFTVFTAISMLIGSGGSTIVSIAMARGEHKRANSLFTQSIILSVVTIGILSGLGLVWLEPLARMLGVNAVIMPMVKDYTLVMLGFALIYNLCNVLNYFVRIDGAPRLAMNCMVFGAVINTALDYVFIFQFHWGVWGAAVATMMGNAVGALILMAYFIRKQGQLRFVRVKFDFADIKRMINIGFAGFLSQLCISIVTYVHNKTMMALMGETAVSAYSVINYIHPLMLMVFMGTAMAVQPIISYNYGAGESVRIQETLSLSMKVSALMGAGSLLIGAILKTQLVGLFLVNAPEVAAIAISGLPIFFINYLFLGSNLVLATYFQSIESPTSANIITLSRGFVIIVVAIYALSKLYGIDGVWVATPLAEGLTMIGSLIFLSRQSLKRVAVTNAISK